VGTIELRTPWPGSLRKENKAGTRNTVTPTTPAFPRGILPLRLKKAAPTLLLGAHYPHTTAMSLCGSLISHRQTGPSSCQELVNKNRDTSPWGRQWRRLGPGKEPPPTNLSGCMQSFQKEKELRVLGRGSCLPSPPPPAPGHKVGLGALGAPKHPLSLFQRKKMSRNPSQLTQSILLSRKHYEATGETSVRLAERLSYLVGGRGSGKEQRDFAACL
jgi:hypothetical protein